MNKNKVVFVCAINGILMFLYPIIGMFLFLDQFFNLTIIFIYVALYAGFLVFLGAFMAKMDYSHLGIDYIKIGINFIRIGVILGFTSLMVLIIIGILLDIFFISTIIFLVLYTILELTAILLSFFIVRKLKEVILKNPRRSDVGYMNPKKLILNN